LEAVLSRNELRTLSHSRIPPTTPVGVGLAPLGGESQRELSDQELLSKMFTVHNVKLTKNGFIVTGSVYLTDYVSSVAPTRPV
jgi:hypothetical protein